MSKKVGYVDSRYPFLLKEQFGITLSYIYKYNDSFVYKYAVSIDPWHLFQRLDQYFANFFITQGTITNLQFTSRETLSSDFGRTYRSFLGISLENLS